MATEATAVTMGHLRAGFLSRSGVTSLTMGDIVSFNTSAVCARDARGVRFPEQRWSENLSCRYGIVSLRKKPDVRNEISTRTRMSK